MVEIDDLSGLWIDVSHAIAFDQNCGVGWVGNLMGLFAEGAGELCHRHHGAAGNPRGFVVAEVGETGGWQRDA